MNPKHILTFVLLLICSSTVSAAWANTSYTNAKNITLLGADTELTNYPYLASVAKESAMQSDYDDLIFYDQLVYGSGNLIEFEIETYNATVATVWLNITTLPTAGKTVSVYYGNATVSSTENSNATWNGDYVGVWHMSDDITSYAWNNYKQPDGILTANASMRYVTAEPNVYHEDGIFKMWQRVRDGPTSASIDDGLGYFTSTDGYDWTYVKSQCFSGCRFCFVMPDPNSSGYWAYNYNETTTNRDLWYGTNETDWAIDTYGIFSSSDLGASSLGNMFVWRENTSDWYAICEYTGPGWLSKYGTSADGKSWTWHSQIIVSGFGSNGCCGPYVHKNNGTYYMWFHGNKAEVDGIPSDTYVATSQNRQDWSYVSGFEILRDQDWEGVGVSAGQLADPHPVEYNSELYIYYQGAHDQSPGATWPHRTGLVHLNESMQEVCDHIDAGNVGTTAADSTSNSKDGTLTDISTSTNGAIGSCMAFDGDSSYINLGSLLNIPTGTHEFWFNTSNIDADANQPYAMDNNGNTPFIIARVQETAGVDKLKTDAGSGGTWFDEYDVSPNTFYSVNIISNSSGTNKLYVNGNEIDTIPYDPGGAGIVGWHFGCGRSISNWYIGTIDEGRVSDVVRSADWINLSYQMVVDSSYVTFGTEQSPSSSTTNYIPPTPTSLTNTTGNDWIKHQWAAGIGNITNTYNISVNSIWYNNSSTNSYQKIYTTDSWQNITVFAYNNSGNGILSLSSISQNTFLEYTETSYFINLKTMITDIIPLLSNILLLVIAYIPIMVGIIIVGFIMSICVGVFGKLKRW